MRILLIEDDAVLADILVKTLNERHYAVDVAVDGEMGWEYAETTSYDLILMDVGLPRLNGIALCQRLRDRGCSTPILLVTAKDASSDRIRGLDAGADDYLIKPLDLEELQARVRALLRRRDVAPTPVLAVGELRLDPSCCQVTYAGKLLKLTPKEYSLLELFLQNPSRVFSRANIIEHLWTFDDPPQEESVKAHIKGLRQKLKAAGAADWIENVYGLGYRLKPQQEVKDRAVAAPTPAVETEFNRAVEGLWGQYQSLMIERLTLLQQAVEEGKRRSHQLRQSAEKAAHKLAGVLGMFDREAEGEIAREIERLLLGEESLSQVEEEKLRSLVQQLSDRLNLTPASTPQPSLKSSPEPLNLSQSIQLLVVDDDPIFLAALRPMLVPWGFQLTELDDPLKFWQTLGEKAPDLLILDVEMPQMSGIELCQAIRNHPQWQALPILFLTAHREAETIQQMFAVGADDYVTKPIVGAELLTRINNRLERIRLLQTLSTKDPIVGLTNQPHSSRNLERILQQIGNNPVSLALLTCVQLHQINIQYGHAMGNQVLQQWGHLFQTIFNQGEIIGYWGNGEFMVGMPGLTKTQASDRLFEILTPLRQQIFTAPDGTRFQAICQFAVVESPTDGQTLPALYQTASKIVAQRSCE